MSRRAALVLAALWALAVAGSLAARPAWPIDETRYLSVGWEMWHRGDLLVPHLNGTPYSDKPPLLFWLMQAGWSVFGVNEWWPRLVPSLFALGSLFRAVVVGRIGAPRALGSARPRLGRRRKLDGARVGDSRGARRRPGLRGRDSLGPDGGPRGARIRASASLGVVPAVPAGPGVPVDPLALSLARPPAGEGSLPRPGRPPLRGVGGDRSPSLLRDQRQTGLLPAAARARGRAPHDARRHVRPDRAKAGRDSLDRGSTSLPRAPARRRPPRVGPPSAPALGFAPIARRRAPLRRERPRSRLAAGLLALAAR